MKRVFGIILPLMITLGLIGLFWWLLSGKQIDVLNPSGEVAEAQLGILLFTVLLSAVVVVPVFGLLIFISIRYRAGNTSAKYIPEWGENKWLEGLWWGIPIIIIGILSVVIWQSSYELDPYKKLSGDSMKVEVIALRWKWLFLYPEYGIATLNYLPMTVGKPVSFRVTADAPMSSFWVPALGSQIYAMKGMTSQLNLKATRPGNFTGYTTNINGEGYANMKFTAKAMSAADFASWKSEALTAKDLLDMSAYEALAKPGAITQERTYRLADQSLYDTIANKAMSKKGTNKPATSSTNSTSTMEMDNQ